MEMEMAMTIQKKIKMNYNEKESIKNESAWQRKA